MCRKTAHLMCQKQNICFSLLKRRMAWLAVRLCRHQSAQGGAVRGNGGRGRSATGDLAAPSCGVGCRRARSAPPPAAAPSAAPSGALDGCRHCALYCPRGGRLVGSAPGAVRADRGGGEAAPCACRPCALIWQRVRRLYTSYIQILRIGSRGARRSVRRAGRGEAAPCACRPCATHWQHARRNAPRRPDQA